MGWDFVKRVNSPLFSKREKVTAVTLSVLTALVLLLISLFLGLNIFKPRGEKKVMPAASAVATESFKVRKGSFGNRPRPYVASVQTKVSNGSRTLFPTTGCPDLLVVDFKYKITADEGKKLRKILNALDGIENVEVLTYRIVLNRPCVSEEFQFWTWEDVWREIPPALEKCFKK